MSGLSSASLTAPTARRVARQPPTPPPWSGGGDVAAAGASGSFGEKRRKLEFASAAEAKAALTTRTAEYDDVFCDAITIEVEDSFFEKGGMVVDDSVAASMEKIPGRYWKVGEMNGYPVYRQEAPSSDAAPNGEQLFLYATKKTGWYVSSEPDEISNSTEHLAWGPMKDDGAFPRRLHLPYWAKRPNKDITLKPLHQWNEERIRLLGDELIAIEQRGEGGGSRATADEAFDRSGLERGSSGGKGGGKLKHKGGGWLNKIVPLIHKVLTGDDTGATLLAEEYAGHPSVAPLLDAHRRREERSTGSL